MTLFDKALKLEWIAMAAGVGYMFRSIQVYSDATSDQDIRNSSEKFDTGLSVVKLSGAAMILTLCAEMIADM